MLPGAGWSARSRGIGGRTSGTGAIALTGARTESLIFICHSLCSHFSALSREKAKGKWAAVQLLLLICFFQCAICLLQPLPLRHWKKN